MVRPPKLLKWGVCALLLLAPGSFVLLPALWLVKSWAMLRQSLSASAPEHLR
jgi:hypothetical protein